MLVAGRTSAHQFVIKTSENDRFALPGFITLFGHLHTINQQRYLTGAGCDAGGVIKRDHRFQC